MHPFCVGDAVICDYDKPLPGRGPKDGEPWIRKGRVYRVRTLLQNTETDMEVCGVELVELPSSPLRDGWCAWRFRKVDRAEDHFIAAMQAVQANASFTASVQKTVAWHYKNWSMLGGYKQARARHIEQLLKGYGEWFRSVFDCYPDATQISNVVCPSSEHLAQLAA